MKPHPAVQKHQIADMMREKGKHMKNFEIKSSLVLASMLATTFANAAQSVTPVAWVGSTFAGETVTQIGGTNYDGTGQLWISGRFGTSDNFFGQASSVFWRNSLSTVGVLGGAEASFGVALNTLVYSPSIDTFDGLIIQSGPTTVFNLKDSDSAPAQDPLFIVFCSGPKMSENGTAIWVSGTSTTNTGSTTARVLYKKTLSGSPEVVWKTGAVGIGTSVDGFTMTSSSGISFTNEIAPNGSAIIASAILGTGSTTNDAAIVKHDVATGLNSIVAQEGTTWPGAATIKTLNNVAMDNAGNTYFSGAMNLPVAEDQFLAKNGVPILTESSKLDGFPLTTRTLSEFDINESNRVVMVWSTTTTDDRDIFIASPDVPEAAKHVLGKGDEFDTDGDWVADSVVTKVKTGTVRYININENLEICARIAYTPIGGGTEIEALVKIPYPKLGDIDRDCEVGPGDFERVVAAFGSGPADATWDAWADVDFDGEVGPSDFEIVVDNFNS